MIFCGRRATFAVVDQPATSAAFSSRCGEQGTSVLFSSYLLIDSVHCFSCGVCCSTSDRSYCCALFFVQVCKA
jgi:hypothetical protein